MRSCPNCEKSISLDAGICPYCHQQVPNLPNYPSADPKWFMVLWVFFVILIIALLVSMFSVR